MHLSQPHPSAVRQHSSRPHAILRCATLTDQPSSTPLVDAVLARGNRLQEVPLHVPGHKRGRALDPSMQQLMMAGTTTTQEAGGSSTPPEDLTSAGIIARHDVSASNPLRYDLTELAGLDYLSSPSSVIEAAQDLAAAAFNAQQTWFLVNGCSVGIHAAVMATVQPGETLLLARNCHLSAYAACVLSDAVPLWLQPEQDSLHGVAHCISPEQLRQGFEVAKQQQRKVAAVLVVSPTYYGAVARIAELAEVCHSEGVPLLVDEAHGGHFTPMGVDVAGQDAPAHTAASATPPRLAVGDAGVTNHQEGQQQQQQNLSVSALDAGADLVMHSSHKVLTAMTQAAMLHLQRGSQVQPSRISKALQVLQTSSPSYLLLSSLDAARRQAFTPGVWLAPLAAATAARDQLAGLPGLCLLQHGSCGAQQSVAGFDPLRLVLNVGGLGMTGYEAAAWLEEHHGVVPELATQNLVVFVFGPGSAHADAAVLIDACTQLSSAHLMQASSTDALPQQPSCSDSTNQSSSSQLGLEGRQLYQHGSSPPAGPTLTPRQAFFADNEAVSLCDAVGRVSAELLCPYPPGVPVVFPGEALSAQAVQLLQDTVASGGVVTGSQDAQLHTVLVVTQDS